MTARRGNLPACSPYHARPVRPLPPAIRIACALIASAWCALAGGCQLIGLPAVMAESYKRSSTHSVDSEYTDLAGHSFAVIVAADRVIQADDPNLVPELIIACAERLRENAGSSGYVPPQTIMAYMANNPRWVAMSPGDLAKDLGVERLIFVDLIDFRLHEPGNAYIWDGRASASVGVLEAESPNPDDFAYRKEVMVKFPNDKNVGREDMQRSVVRTRLQLRLVDRIVWNFYEHEEPYYPEY